MGFDAIWVSPITKQFEQNTGHGQAYHGYWQQDLYSLNKHFGTGDDLRALADELHKRGMFLMIDVVVGHTAWPGSRDTVDYTVFEPFNNESYYHSGDCLTADAGSDPTQTQNCWLGDDVVALPDIRTEDDSIAKLLQSFVADTVKNFAADGIRIDSVVNISPGVLPGINKAAGVYCIGEVLQGATATACGYQDYMDGFINYAQYFPLIAMLKGNDAVAQTLVQELSAIQSKCKDPSLLGSFSENHDNPRLGYYTDDMSLASNAMAFDIMYDGIPIIYQGQEQKFSGGKSPYNREALWPSKYDQSAPLYKLASTLNSLRTQTIKANDSYLQYGSEVVYSDDHNIAFRKGYAGDQVITIINNNGAIGTNFTLEIPETSFVQGANLTEVVGCTSVIVGSNSTFTATITNGMPAVYALSSIVDQTVICNPEKAKAMASASASASAASATKTSPIANKTGLVATATAPRSSAGNSIFSSKLGNFVIVLLIILLV
ncbi:putative alpha-amylase a type-1 2 [Phaeomoniella chlamydospora]|uniref:alpha-amylase n=1 Tax=Phaeomoniella chlamydospora TaxID=158046 RepID=A0A0G2GGL5_PHACM|nr:putative alpha-amylase a type-1 2 [Phaeomoniella chlamydospora]